MVRRRGSSDDIIGSPRRIGAIVIAGLSILLLVFMAFQVATTVDASEIVVKQNVLDGELQVWTTPGIKGQWFGDTERYPKSSQFWFEAADKGQATEESSKVDRCFRIRFNDQGTAKLCGSVSWEMPTDAKSVIALHEKFRSHLAIEQRLIKPALDKAIYNSGPLMSSRESAGDRRSELLTAIREQTSVGVYKVKAEEVEVEDFFAEPIEGIKMVPTPVLCPDPAPEGSSCKAGEPMLGDDGKPKMELKPKKVMVQPKKKVKIVKPTVDENGRIEIAEASTVAAFNIRLFNFTINRIAYDERVTGQIKSQQEATMAIQTSRALSLKAEQDAITTKAEGANRIAKTKADEEVAKQQLITRAEARKEQASLDLETASIQAKSTRVTADAEAYKKKQAIIADGALDKKLAALMKINEYWAAAASKHQLVPTITMGGKGAGGGIQGMMDVMSAKAARDLAVDMKIK